MTDQILASVTQMVRPLKIWFLVDLRRWTSVKDAIMFSSMLWGWIHNIIIPFWSKTAKIQEINKHIDLIQTTRPDFIVNLTKYSIPEQICKLYDAEFLKNKEDFVLTEGIDIRFGLWIRIYPVLNAFLSSLDKDKLNDHVLEFMSYWASNPFDISLMANCWYLGNTKLSRLFTEKLSGKFISNYSEYSGLSSKSFTALDVGSWKLRSVGNHGALQSSVVFVGNSDNKADIIEFWNIRACWRRWFFLPIDEIEVCRGILNEFISNNYYPINDNGYYNTTSIIKGELIDQEKFSNLTTRFINEENRRNKCSTQSWIPWWNDPSNDFVMKQIICPTFYEKTKNNSLNSINGIGISFDLEHPEFFSEDALHRYQKPYFAVDIEARSYSQNDKTFNVPLIPELSNLIKYRVYNKYEGIRIRQDKVSIFIDKREQTIHIDSIDIMEIFREYFQANGILIAFSKPWVIANRIMAHMWWNIDYCRIFKLEGVRKLLKELSTVTWAEGSNKREKSKELIKKWKTYNTIYDSINHRHPSGADYQWLLRFDKYEQNGRWVFMKLFDHNILRPGLLFECENCQKNDWYWIEEFQKEFSCRHCFHKQKVSLVNWNSDKQWRYKPDWLFALPDGGQGSISTILSLWYLNHFSSLWSSKLLLTSIDCKITWQKDPIESDFCVFFENELIIGEGKNLTELKKSDIEKMILLWKSLIRKPIICLSTLKDAFSNKEKWLIKIIINKGFLVLPLTRLDLDPYDTRERFKDSKYGHPMNIRELIENLYALNLCD